MQRAIELTHRVNEGEVSIVAEDPDTATRVLESFRTLFETFVVTWTSTERPRRVDPFPIDRLKYLLEGADLPAEDSNQKARSTQFELLVGANLILGGTDIRPEEPDYRLLYHGDYVGVAAKRVRSLNPDRVRGLLRDALDQFERYDCRGFIALNLDRWIVDLASEDIREVGRLFNEQLQGAHKEIGKISGNERLLGAMIFTNWSRWCFDGPKPTIDWRAPAQFVGFGDTLIEQRRFEEFFGPFRSRWEANMEELGRLLEPTTPPPQGRQP